MQGQRLTIPYHTGKVLHPKIEKSVLKNMNIDVGEFKKLFWNVTKIPVLRRRHSNQFHPFVSTAQSIMINLIACTFHVNKTFCTNCWIRFYGAVYSLLSVCLYTVWNIFNPCILFYPLLYPHNVKNNLIPFNKKRVLQKSYGICAVQWTNRTKCVVRLETF